MQVVSSAKSLVVRAGSTAANQLNADRLLQRSMATFIELAQARRRLGSGSEWKPGQPLKLLMIGYNGTRNTGADVRVQEMMRQFRALLGDDHLALSIATVDPQCSRGYFPMARQLHMPKVFPKFVFDQVHNHHAVVVAEGSMFKSHFANALCTLMVGALGVARAEGKLAVAYGGEAGAMDASIRQMVKTHASDALILVRNRQSAEVLRDLGLESQVGTDTAWTFEPSPETDVRRLLSGAGWDGKKPLLAVCPINGFWWPVTPSVTKSLLRMTTGAYGDDHYGSLYFHRGGPEVKSKQDAYIRGLAEAVNHIKQTHDAFVFVVGMERLDRSACQSLCHLLGAQTPMFVSDEWNMHVLVALLREATWLISSRYHAIVTTMPSGTLSLGVTMDERIRNLMADRGQPELALDINADNLGESILAAWEHLRANPEQVREGILRSVVGNLHRMGTMGEAFTRAIAQRFPEFPLRQELRDSHDAWDFLPPLSDALTRLIGRYKGTI
jgi:polysaccharide pyruvyl transferase WcaK-like protein